MCRFCANQAVRSFSPAWLSSSPSGNRNSTNEGIYSRLSARASIPHCVKKFAPSSQRYSRHFKFDRAPVIALRKLSCNPQSTRDSSWRDCICEIATAKLTASASPTPKSLWPWSEIFSHALSTGIAFASWPASLGPQTRIAPVLPGFQHSGRQKLTVFALEHTSSKNSL